jgi:hypothetical protein
MFGKSPMGFCSPTFEFYEIEQRLFPLLAGEGLGEGERDALLLITKKQNDIF